MANINEIISYGIQNRKRKDEILNALLKAGADIPSATNTLKSLNESGVFDYEGSGFGGSNNVGTPENNFGVDQTQLGTEQNKAFGFGKRTLESGKTISSLESNIANKGFWGGIEQAIDEKQVGTTLFNRYVSKEFQQFDQAKRDFVNALLRRESGAAISPDEFKSAEKQYFPVPGDKPENVEQKRKNRELVTKGLLGEAGVNTSNLSLDDANQGGEQVDPLQNFNATLQYAQQNPDDERSQKFLEMIKTGQIDPTTGKLVESKNQSMLTGEKTGEEQDGEKKEGFFSDIAKAFNKRTNANADILNTGDKTSSKILQSTGQNLGFFGDIAGSAISRTLSAITPDWIEKPVTERVNELITAGLDTKAAKKTIEEWDKIKKTNPELARNIEGIGNIASFAAWGFGSGKAADVAKSSAGEVLSKSGTLLEKSGVAGVDAAKKSFSQDLVRAVENKATRIDQVGRTTEKGFGPFKRSVIKPTPLEKKAAQEVSKITGISSKKTLQQNYNIISDAVVEEAKVLEAKLLNNDFVISKKEITSKLNKAAETLEASPLIVGDAQKTANRLLAGAKQIINKAKGTGSGLLKARKDFDKWVLKQKPKAFDAKAENAFTLANRTVRDSINDLLESKAVNVEIKNSLKKQSSLYNALKNIAPKAAEEADTALGRALQSAGKILGTKSKIVQGIAATVGIGGLGAAATFAPAVAVTGVGGWLILKGGKLVASPEARVAIGKLLRIAGKTMNPKNKQILEGLIEKSKSIRPGLNILEVNEAITQTLKNLRIAEKAGNKKNIKILNKQLDDLYRKRASGNLDFNEAGTASSAKPLQEGGLIQEAKKYKTADEFIDSLSSKNRTLINPEDGGIYLHGTDAKNYDSLLKNGFDTKLNKKGFAEQPEAVFVGDSIEARMYGDKVVAVRAKKGVKVKTIRTSEFTAEQNSQFKTGLDEINWAKKNGYDAINVGDEIIIVNPKKFEVFDKSKLKDIWNKAHGK